MRNPIVAGTFYPASKRELGQEIRNAFLGTLGPGKLPEISKQGKKIYGVVVPHAGYIYSAQAAAHAYKRIAKSKQTETFIILGTNHTGYVESNFAISTQDFLTPFGIVKNDEEFSNLLISDYKRKRFSVGETSGDKLAHKQEHSIEVQLPFLQFIFQDKFRILPIICQQQDHENYVEFAKLIVETAKKLKRKICIIASSDFTHYGFNYGFVPFTINIKKNLYELDKGAIDLIVKFKTKEFLQEASKTTICGAASIATAIETCKQLGSKKAKLLKYYTSGDITGDYGSAVGYASIIFE